LLIDPDYCLILMLSSVAEKMSDTEEAGSSAPNTGDVSELIVFMIGKLPAEDKRRALQKLMSSTSGEPQGEMGGQSDENGASSRQDKYSVGAGDSTIVVKSSSCTAAKLRHFSGTVPVPSGQVDFRTWYNAAIRLCRHPDIADDEKFARIHNSLSSPALDIAQSSLDAESPEAALKLLKNVYGSVEDPRDVLNDFHTTIMTSKEQPSEYLTRLYLKLQKLKSLDIEQSDPDSSLLKQFIYGCSDETMIMKLRLEEREHSPPEYSDLLLSLRTEEAKRNKRKFGHNLIRSCQQNAGPADAENTELIQLKKEVAALQSQLANLSATHDSPGGGRSATTSPSASSSRSMEPTARPARRKLKFCFKCGEPGHVVWRCNKSPNPELVCRMFEESRQGN